MCHKCFQFCPSFSSFSALFDLLLAFYLFLSCSDAPPLPQQKYCDTKLIDWVWKFSDSTDIPPNILPKLSSNHQWKKTISSWLKKQTYKNYTSPDDFEKKYIQLFCVCAKVQHFFATKNQISRFWLLNNQLMLLLLVLENTFVVCIG